MSDQAYIIKDRPLRPTKDYYFLRERGMELIRQYCEQTWTDHNTHDPGITILEVLIHALTDLGYRTDFSMEDSLATAVDLNIITYDDIGFFKQMDILTLHPWTINDYRRLLMQVSGVRNAWVIPLLEDEMIAEGVSTQIYVDCLNKALSFEKTNKLKKKNHQIYLKGFYQILLELEIDEELGSLNSYDLIANLEVNPHKGRIVRLSHPMAHSLPFDEDFQIQTVEKVKSTTGVIIKNHWNITVQFTGASSLNTQFLLNDHRIKSRFDGVDFIKGQVEIETVLKSYLKKVDKIGAAIKAAEFAYHANRNLCEDLVQIGIVAIDRIGICMDIDLKPDADMEKVQAEVYLAIEHYLNPPIPFKSLQEMEGVPEASGETIFNMPFIENPDAPVLNPDTGARIFDFKGFLSEEDLHSTRLKKRLLASDIINELMEIEGVQAVRNLIMRSFDGNGEPLAMHEWCLPIRDLHQGIFDQGRSKILFFKNDIPFLARRLEFLETHTLLRANNRRADISLESSSNKVILGRKRQIPTHYSILNDFPDTYGIGEVGLSNNAGAKRKAQAKQLQAYLLLYDQILGDYLEQLSHVPELLSVKTHAANEPYHSYFSSNLKNATGMPQNVTETLLEESITNDAKRLRLLETEAEGLERRSRFLDHLLSRYNESLRQSFLFLDTLYSLDQDQTFLRPKSERDIIDNKLLFLREYDLISRNRGKAYNYLLNRGLWKNEANNEDGNNISGLQRRIGRALGMDPERQSLYCAEIYEEIFVKIGNEYRIHSKDNEGNTFEFMNSNGKETLYPHLRIPDRYIIQTVNTQEFQIRLRDQGGQLLATSSQTYASYVEALQALRQFWSYYDRAIQEKCGESIHEGFHLIEHLLLRPIMMHPNTLMDVCIGDDCIFCGEEDPYSFRISFYFPYWPSRFRIAEIRTYIENFVREQTPAHIHARICWLENGQMYELETAYKNWLILKTQEHSEPTAYQEALASLIKIMESLTDVHPEAFLHDCEEDSEENPVKLNNTHLGTF